MIKIPKDYFDKIIAAAQTGISEEICGLLAGTVSNDEKMVKEIYFIENTDHSNEHFAMNIKEQFDAVKDMRSRGFVLLGMFHSHPEGPSELSAEDKRLAYDKTVSYLVLSLMNKPVLKSFKISDKIAEEERIIIL